MVWPSAMMLPLCSLPRRLTSAALMDSVTVGLEVAENMADSSMSVSTSMKCW